MSTQSLWAYLDTEYTQEDAVSWDVANNADVIPPSDLVNYDIFHNEWLDFYHKQRIVVHITDEDAIASVAKSYEDRLIEWQKKINAILAEKARKPIAPIVKPSTYSEPSGGSSGDMMHTFKLLGIGAGLGLGAFLVIKLVK